MRGRAVDKSQHSAYNCFVNNTVMFVECNIVFEIAVVSIVMSAHSWLVTRESATLNMYVKCAQVFVYEDPRSICLEYVQYSSAHLQMMS